MAKKAWEKTKPSRSKKHQAESSVSSKFFLEHIKMTSFGKFANLIVGPFGPGVWS